MVITLTEFVAGLGVLGGTIVGVLGLALTQVSDLAVWRSTGRKICALGIVLCLFCLVVFLGEISWLP